MSRDPWASFDSWLTRDVDDEREDTRKCADCDGEGQIDNDRGGQCECPMCLGHGVMVDDDR